MTDAADRIFTDAEGHTLGEPDREFEAVAVRDGRIVRVGSDYEIAFLEGVDTDVFDCGGRVLLPGFVDAHTHLEMVGRRLVHADLGAAADRDAALERLREASGSGPDEWVLGYGYDESTWPDQGFLTREELDDVSKERPVVAFREDLHTASANSVVFDRYADEFPEDGVLRNDAGEPTGVVTEAAAELLRTETAPDREETRQLVLAARDRAHELGVTGVHDMVRRSHAPAVYRELAVAGELALRVRLYYWVDHLDAVAELGLRTNHGGPFVEVGGIKTYTDGSLGARTAKLSEPYADVEGPGSDDDGQADTGEWVVAPDELAAIADLVDDLGLQLAIHAIGDEAIDVALGTLPEDPDARHRIEHAELPPSDLSRWPDGVVASMQPNFLRWAREGGLYEARLGEERTAAVNPFSAMLEAGTSVAFGSDCMPLDPLYGVQQAVTAPQERQRLTVTEALRTYTWGSAYAGHAEDRSGTVEAGKRADFVVIEESPWEVDPDRIADVDVAMTVVDGEVVYSR